MFPGIDISGNNPIDVVTGDEHFVFVKLTEGETFVDDWDARVRRCQEVGVACVGGYHFARPDLHNDPQAEADNFISEMLDAGLTCAALDAEVGAMDAAWALRWCELVEHATGVTPFIYTSDRYARTNLWGREPALARFPLWVAQWGVDEPDVPIPWQDWTIWQYGGDGIDRNWSKIRMDEDNMLDNDDKQFIGSTADDITKNVQAQLAVAADNITANVAKQLEAFKPATPPSSTPPLLSAVPSKALLDELARRVS